MAGDRELPLTRRTERQNRLEKVQLLIVNSSEKAAELLKSIFHEIGFKHVLSATNAADAVFMMRQMRIDIVVVDDALHSEMESNELTPGWEEATGVDFVKLLRHSSASPNPFALTVVMVDEVTSDRILGARDAGVNEVVMKPLNAREFCMRITNLFDKPRNFVTAPSYKGPCRRRRGGPPPGEAERRVREVRLIRCDELRSPT